MADDSLDDDTPRPDHRRASGPRPLSRRASRLLVIGALVLVLLLSAASVWYLLRVAEPAPPPDIAPPAAPADTVVHADTTSGM